ncbi:hypothetical protein [Kineococcus rhizosphaerae]|uniref:Uncharacterized protein n=1 Tax=Kineococcus rhizosphaerae TaxID=559628 RepID=A0A2T0QNA5_9ACTN|nr:hypothetical protein [Kineococcus rhizosphaerae]PRY06092.1 hypothetical protein CLV37_1357 [Kineococcus rhizosphaerae]
MSPGPDLDPERRGPLRLTLDEARRRFRGELVQYRDHHVQADVDGFPSVVASDPIEALVYWPPDLLGWPIEDLLDLDPIPDTDSKESP